MWPSDKFEFETPPWPGQHFNFYCRLGFESTTFQLFAACAWTIFFRNNTFYVIEKYLNEYHIAISLKMVNMFWIQNWFCGLFHFALKIVNISASFQKSISKSYFPQLHPINVWICKLRHLSPEKIEFNWKKMTTNITVS